MPDLNAPIHLDWLDEFKKKNRLPVRVWRALQSALGAKEIYGLQWGDPDTFGPLKFIRDRYVLPYVNPQHNAVEIGPGGGRWTRYLLGFGKLYVVDYFPQMLQELARNMNRPNITFVKNNGTDFPGVPEGEIDYIFSFGTFVHLDLPLIQAYLKNIKPIIKPGANIVIQYSDKSKVMAQSSPDFSDNTPEKMRGLVLDEGYRILEQDLTTLWHSSIIRFTK